MKLYTRFVEWIRSDTKKETKTKKSNNRLVYEHDLHTTSLPVKQLINNDKKLSHKSSYKIPFVSRRGDLCYRFLSVLFTAVIGIVLLVMVLDSPISGVAVGNPTLNEVPYRYIASGIEETGAVNFVTGVLLDYRAFDTFGEASMVFTTTGAVVFLQKNFFGKSGD